MPCLTDIIDQLYSEIDSLASKGRGMSISNANKLADEINKKYDTKVISYKLTNDLVDYDIRIPASLSKKYYDKELQLEGAEETLAKGNVLVNENDDVDLYYESTEDFLFKKNYIPATVLNNLDINQFKILKERQRDLLLRRLKEIKKNKESATDEKVYESFVVIENEIMNQLYRFFDKEEGKINIQEQLNNLKVKDQNSMNFIIDTIKNDILDTEEELQKLTGNYDLDAPELTRLKELLMSYSKLNDVNSNEHLFLQDIEHSSQLQEETFNKLNLLTQAANDLLNEIRIKENEYLKTNFENKSGLTTEEVKDQLNKDLAVDDINFLESWFTSIDYQFSNDTIHGQIAMRTFFDAYNESMEDLVKYQKRLKELRPRLSSELKKLGLKEDFSIFRRKSLNGKFTNEIITSTNQEWDNFIKSFINQFGYYSDNLKLVRGKKGSFYKTSATNYIKKINETIKDKSEPFLFYKCREFYDNNFRLNDATEQSNIDDSYRNSVIERLGQYEYDKLVNIAKSRHIAISVEENDNTIIKLDEVLNDSKYFNSFSPKHNINHIYNSMLFVPSDSKFIDERFNTIKNNEILLESLNTFRDAWDSIKNKIPNSESKMLGTYGIITLDKTFGEIFKSNSEFKNGSSKLKMVWDHLVNLFVKNIRVKDSRLIDNQLYNDVSTKGFGEYIEGYKKDLQLEISKFSSLTKGEINNKYFTIQELMNETKLIEVLKDELGLNSDNELKVLIEKFYTSAKGNVLLKSMIETIVKENFYQNQSFDLFKLTDYFLQTSTLYDARNKAKDRVELVINDYKSIKSGKKNSVGMNLLDKYSKPKAVNPNQERTNATKKFNEWYNRTVLGLDDSEAFVKIPIFGKVYTKDEKNKIKEIDELLNKKEGLSGYEIQQLNNIKNSFGGEVYLSRLIQGIIKFIQLKGIGWNVNSAIGNFLEGRISNYILGVSNEYVKVETLMEAESISMGSEGFNGIKKGVTLMEKYNILQDSTNELQKAEQRASNKVLNFLNPFGLNSKVELMNQMPMTIALLKESFVKNDKGEELSISVWDALNEKGELLPEYNNEYNSQWVTLQGDDFNKFRYKVDDFISKGHGNYNKFKGMQIKHNIFGQMYMVFKTWFPNQVVQRFGNENYSIATGKKIKGRYKSYSPISAGLIGSVGVGIMFGPYWALGGLFSGMLAASFNGVKPSGSSVQILKQTSLALLKEFTRLGANLALRTKYLKDLKSKVNKKLSTENNFSEIYSDDIDIRNMQANMAEIAIMLMSFVVFGIAKGLYDDDDEESAGNYFYNYMVNTSNKLLNQITTYSNPSSLLDFVSTSAFNRFIQQLNELTTAIIEHELDDVYIGGKLDGKNIVMSKLDNAFMPKNPISNWLGLKYPSTKLSKPVEENFWNDFFSSEQQNLLEEEKNIKSEIKQDRKKLRVKLENEYGEDNIITDDEKKLISSEINKEIPTFESRKKKLKIKDKNLTEESINKLKNK